MAISLLADFPTLPTRAGIGHDFLTDEDLVAYTVTAIAAGTCAVIDTNDAGRNGIALFSSVDGTEDKGAQIQLDAEPFQLAANKDLVFQSRFKMLEVVQSDALWGLAITDTTLIASAPSDGVYFLTEDGADTFKFVVRAGGVAISSVSLGSLVADTYITLGFKIDGVTAGAAGVAYIYVNGALFSTIALAGLPLTEALALSAAFQSGQAVLNTMHLDLLAADQLR